MYTHFSVCSFNLLDKDKLLFPNDLFQCKKTFEIGGYKKANIFLQNLTFSWECGIVNVSNV